MSARMIHEVTIRGNRIGVRVKGDRCWSWFDVESDDTAFGGGYVIAYAAGLRSTIGRRITAYLRESTPAPPRAGRRRTTA